MQASRAAATRGVVAGVGPRSTLQRPGPGPARLQHHGNAQAQDQDQGQPHCQAEAEAEAGAGAEAKAGAAAPRSDYIRHAVTLKSGSTMPTIGMGTARLAANTEDTVRNALAHGYRLFDTASDHAGYADVAVGHAVSSFAGSVPRVDIFLVTKIQPKDHGYGPATAAVQRALQALGTPCHDCWWHWVRHAIARVGGFKMPPTIKI